MDKGVDRRKTVTKRKVLDREHCKNKSKERYGADGERERNDAYIQRGGELKRL